MAINQAGLNVSVRVNLANNRIASAPTQPITLKSTARTVNAVKDLLDVVEAAPADGDTLVYNSVIDKYEVKKLTAGDITIAELDGGTF